MKKRSFTIVFRQASFAIFAILTACSFAQVQGTAKARTFLTTDEIQTLVSGHKLILTPAGAPAIISPFVVEE